MKSGSKFKFILSTQWKDGSMNFLRKLFGMCVHTYETEHTFEKLTMSSENLIGYRFIDKCTKCNHRKIVEIDLK